MALCVEDAAVGMYHGGGVCLNALLQSAEAQCKAHPLAVHGVRMGWRGVWIVPRCVSVG